MKKTISHLCLFGIALVLSSVSLADEASLGAPMASCSVGTMNEPFWYGDVSIPQYLTILPGTHQVTASSEGSLDSEKNLWKVAVTGMGNPRYPLKTIGLATADVAAFGRGTVIFMDLKKDLRIDCVLKE